MHTYYAVVVPKLRFPCGFRPKSLPKAGIYGASAVSAVAARQFASDCLRLLPQLGVGKIRKRGLPRETRQAEAKKGLLKQTDVIPYTIAVIKTGKAKGSNLTFGFSLPVISTKQLPTFSYDDSCEDAFCACESPSYDAYASFRLAF
ncbi:MAG: hypothetical protein J6K28_06340 [Alistipes sp.]|nr:hypothetical protein [Alistipes sp.]